MCRILHKLPHLRNLTSWMDVLHMKAQVNRIQEQKRNTSPHVLFLDQQTISFFLRFTSQDMVKIVQKSLKALKETMQLTTSDSKVTSDERNFSKYELLISKRFHNYNWQGLF